MELKRFGRCFLAVVLGVMAAKLSVHGDLSWVGVIVPVFFQLGAASMLYWAITECR